MLICPTQRSFSPFQRGPAALPSSPEPPKNSGSKGQPLACLKTALSGTTGSVCTQSHTAWGKTGKSCQRRAPRLAASRQSAGHISSCPEPNVETHEHVPEQGDSAQLDNASSCSIEDMFGQDDPEEPVSPAQQSLSPAQRTTIEAIVTESMSNALVAFCAPENGHVLPPLDQRSRAPGMASPLGLTRPVDRHLEDKILHSEYVDLALRCCCRTIYISPRPPSFSYGKTTQPEAPWAPW